MGVKEVLKKNDFHFNKRYGQNFLTDDNLLDNIVAKSGVTEADTVVEIGCGGGTLTAAIARKAKRVIGFEIDENLKPVLKETLADYKNVEIIFKDIMKMKTAEIDELAGENYCVVANLPYYITTPILMKFIEESTTVKSITVTVQEEVADRLCAKAGTEEYGAITAGIDVSGTAEKVMRIGRNMFYPAPNVDSAVVRIVIDRNKYEGVDYEKYRAAVRAAFSSRRKTLCNNLMNSFGFKRSEAEQIVSEISDNPLVRGETLTTADFVKLSNLIK